MNHYPKITIVTPSYNQASFLEETILSVLDQNYPNLEYIIMDGGSNDGSIEIIKKYADRIHYWESKKDNGQSDAINKGLAMATGEIATWLNSDDYYLPGSFHKVAELWNQQPFHFLVGHCYFVDSKGKLIESQTKSKLIEGKKYLPFTNECIINQPASFFSLKTFKECGPLDQSLHYAMDVDFWMKIAATNCNFLFSNDYFTNFRRHENAKSAAGNIEFIEDTLKSRFYTKELEKINPAFYKVARKLGIDCYLYNLRLEHFGKKLFKQGRNYFFSEPFIVIKHWLAYLTLKLKLSIKHFE